MSWNEVGFNGVQNQGLQTAVCGPLLFLSSIFLSVGVIFLLHPDGFPLCNIGHGHGHCQYTDLLAAVI